MQMEIANDKFHNLTRRKHRALYGFQNSRSMIRGSDKSSVVVVSVRENSNKETEQQLQVKNVCEEVPNPPSVLF